MATTEQLDMLRAMVTTDFERHEQLSHTLKSSGGLDGYGTVIAAAFFIAIRKQFPEGHTSADVIRLVADVRARFDLAGETINPNSAELVVRSALGEPDLADQVPDAEMVHIQMITVSELAASHKLGDAEQFMHEVQVLVNRWSAAENPN